MFLCCWLQPNSRRRGSERPVQVQCTIFGRSCNDSWHYSSDCLHPPWILSLFVPLLRLILQKVFS